MEHLTVAVPSNKRHWALALGAACALAVRALLQHWRLRRTPPGTLGLPILGETISYMVDPVNFVAEKKRRHGSIFKTSILFAPCVHLTGERSKLFAKNQNIAWPAHFNALLGETAMAVISGSRHKFQRAVGGAAFTDKALESYVPEIEALTKRHLDLWVAKSQGGPFDPHSDVKFYTFEIAEKILLGTNSGEGLRGMMDTFTYWLAGFEAVLPFNLPFTCFGKAMKARDALLQDYQRVIDEKRASGNLDGSDMLSLVMKEGTRGEPMTDQELRDFSISMMFAGHDTTKATIQSMLHFLHARPEIREELEKEISAVWDGKSPLTWEQIQTCQAGKCGRFGAEILRVMPVVSNIFRQVTEETEIDGYRVPKGWKITVSIADLQDTLNIDMDMSVDHAALKQTENCPFGMGSRMCIGYRFARLELTIWLMHTLKNYRIDVTQSKEVLFPFHYMSVEATFHHKTQ